MADLAASDVTYTIVAQMREDRGQKMNLVTLAFGDGALTYPAGGIPMTKAKMGMFADLSAMIPVGNATAGYVFQFDKANQKLMVLSSSVSSTAAHTHTTPAHAHDIVLKDATQADGATTRVNATANKLGANTGGDITITGAGANGGVQNSAAGVSGSSGAAVTATALAQATGAALAAQSINFLVFGY